MSTRRSTLLPRQRAAGWMTACVGLMLPVASATAGDLDGLYITASAVRTLHTIDSGGLSSAVSTAVQANTDYSLSVASASLRQSEVTWSAGLGYRPLDFLAVEASYLDLGRLEYQGTGTETSPGAASSSLSTDLKITSKGPVLALVGILPVVDAVEINARVAAYEGKTTTSYSNLIDGSPYTGSPSKTSTSLLFGVGAAYVLSGSWLVRLDYVHIDRVHEEFVGARFNVDLATAGLAFMF